MENMKKVALLRAYTEITGNGGYALILIEDGQEIDCIDFPLVAAQDDPSPDYISCGILFALQDLKRKGYKLDLDF